MRLLILGASGGTGRLLVEQALAAGHAVTAFVKDPTRLRFTHGNLRVAVGDVMRPESIGLVVAGHDAVLSALGNKPEGADRARGQPNVPVCSVGTGHAIAAMQASGVRRLVVESSASVGDSKDFGRFPAPWVLRTVLGSVMADKEIQEASVRASGLDWTIIRPVKMSDRARTDRVHVAHDLPWSLSSKVSRADVAAVMLRALTDPGAIGRALTVANA